jgi:hypothetical protein
MCYHDKEIWWQRKLSKHVEVDQDNHGDDDVDILEDRRFSC